MRQQQQPQYEFSTDEEADFEEYGIQDAAQADEEEEVDLDDEDGEEDLVYEDDSDELDDGNPSQAQMPHGYQH